MTTTAATDSSTTETSAAVVASSAPSTTSLSSLTASATTATPYLRPGVVAEAVSRPALLSYRRTCGSGRWVQRHITGKTTRTVLAESAPSPLWDSHDDDNPPYLPVWRSGPIWPLEAAA